MMNDQPRGFTLIELLVVVSIIGLLSSFIAFAVNEARAKARDTKRLADLYQVTRAIELYRNENQDYPLHGGTNYGCGSATCLAVLTDELVPAFISQIPLDPVQGNTSNGYRYCRADAPRQGYQMMVRLESDSTWCTVRTSSPIQGSGTSCWTTNGVPSYAWCD